MSNINFVEVESPGDRDGFGSLNHYRRAGVTERTLCGRKVTERWFPGHSDGNWGCSTCHRIRDREIKKELGK